MPVLVSSFSIWSLLVGCVSQCPFPFMFMQLGSGRPRNLSWGHAKLCSEAQITTSDSIWSQSQTGCEQPLVRVCVECLYCVHHFFYCVYFFNFTLPVLEEVGAWGAACSHASLLGLRVAGRTGSAIARPLTISLCTYRSVGCAAESWRLFAFFLSVTGKISL